MLYCITIVSIISFVGCSSAIELETADALAISVVDKLVSTYCKLPQFARNLNHERWKEKLSPNEITITCNK